MKNLGHFLKESNAIEGVYDEESYLNALKAWEYLIEQDTIDDMVVKKTHYILMQGKLKDKEIGYYRQIDVMVGSKICASWRNLTMLMHAWCKLSNDTQDWEAIKDSHKDYELIHPFVDGNGRTGRMFMNWQRLMIGEDILVIKENEKQAYYDWFKD